MTYLPGIPLGTDNLSTSQGDLKTNFGQLEIVFDEDHYTWDDPTAGGDYRGQHRQVNLPQTYTDTSTPVPTLVGNAGAFITQTGNTDDTPRAEPFFVNNTGAAASENQVLWYGGLTSLAATGQIQASVTANGFLVLPNGLQIVWGKVEGVSNGQTITFPKAFPANVFSLIIGYDANSAALGVSLGYRGSTLSTTTFELIVSVVSATTVDLNYVAFGN